MKSLLEIRVLMEKLIKPTSGTLPEFMKKKMKIPPVK